MTSFKKNIPAGKKPTWTLSRDLVLALLLLFLIPTIVWYLMNKGPNNYFGNPLNIPVSLSANFGELRSNHFHMGLDIRTRGKENLPVYAVADGYISRVSIEENGFGRAIYITHPNNTTTLYAHLNRFEKTLDVFVRQKQYSAQRWEQDLLIEPAMFPVNKGQFIAWSGNTGGSEAPHLHFEVRDTRSGNNLDPLTSGLNLPDDLPPVIQGLYWYNRQLSTYQAIAHEIAITGNDGRYNAKKAIIKVNRPLISFGIRAKDKCPEARSLMGITYMQLWFDDTLVHQMDLHEFSYADSRFINAGIDYTKWIRTGMFIQHLSTLPGNRMPVFACKGHNGVLNLADGLPHSIRIVVGDAAKNESRFDGRIQYDGTSQPYISKPSAAAWPLPGKEHHFNNEYLQLRFSATAFYDIVPFTIQQHPDAGAGKASDRFDLHNPTVPVHDSFTVSLKTSLKSNDPLRKKTVMQLSSRGEKIVVKGQWEGDWMKAAFDQLGTVQLLVDNTAPVIGLPQWIEHPSLQADQKLLQVACTDNLGRIADFRAELDGQWLLFERKGNLFSYRPDNRCKKGAHQLLIRATDMAGNTAQHSYSWLYLVFPE